MQNDLGIYVILACICTFIGALVGQLFAMTWYYGAFLGFLVGIGIPLIGVFGIHD